MLKRLIAAAALILLIVPFADAKQGKGNGNGKGKGHGKGAAYVASPVRVDIFIEQDRRILRDYVLAHPGGLPPGLAKRDGDLPPGLAKQLRRKGHLPPGLEKKLMPCPHEIEVQMAPLAPGLTRGFISGRAVIYNPSTRVIFDVFFPL